MINCLRLEVNVSLCRCVIVMLECPAMRARANTSPPDASLSRVSAVWHSMDGGNGATLEFSSAAPRASREEKKAWRCNNITPLQSIGTVLHVRLCVFYCGYRRTPMVRSPILHSLAAWES